MISFAKRNLKIFFRDRTGVFFSLLAVLIVLGLYVLFLGDQLVKSLDEQVSGAKYLMDSWIMAGILAVTPVSSTLGSFGAMVDDKSKKIYKDFRCSPIKSSKLVGGYIISSFCVGTIMSVFAFIIIEIYLVVSFGEILSAAAMFKVLGVILCTVLASSAMMYFIVSFFKSQNAFATASTIIGTLIGFITGIYLPIGSTPKAVQYIIEIFPISHSASLFRKIFMEVPMSQSFDGIPKSFLTDFKLSMGVNFKIGDHNISSVESVGYLLLSAVLLYIFGIAVTYFKKEN